jgi:hypothetical protein
VVKQGAGGGDSEAVKGIRLHDSSRARTVERDGQLLASTAGSGALPRAAPFWKKAVKAFLCLRATMLAGCSGA